MSSDFDDFKLRETGTDLFCALKGKSPIATLGTKVIMNYSQGRTVQEGIDFAKLWNMVRFFFKINKKNFSGCREISDKSLGFDRQCFKLKIYLLPLKRELCILSLVGRRAGTDDFDKIDSQRRNLLLLRN